MFSKIKSFFYEDEKGNPAGGCTQGNGFTISWQNGHLGNGMPEGLKLPNGAFVEDVIKASIERLEFYQDSKFACEENALALNNLRAALANLDSRTKKRIERGVEGTMKV